MEFLKGIAPKWFSKQEPDTPNQTDAVTRENDAISAETEYTSTTSEPDESVESSEVQAEQDDLFEVETSAESQQTAQFNPQPVFHQPSIPEPAPRPTPSAKSEISVMEQKSWNPMIPMVVNASLGGYDERNYRPISRAGQYILCDTIHTNYNKTIKVYKCSFHKQSGDKAIEPQNPPKAIKVFDFRHMTELEAEFALNEYDLHLAIWTAVFKKGFRLEYGILPLHNMWYDPHQQQRYLVFPYCEGVSLRKMMEKRNNKPLPEAQIRRLMLGVREGLFQMRDNQMMHRDIKPENILLHEGKTYLADFGIAARWENARKYPQSVFIGTRSYAPPEAHGFIKPVGWSYFDRSSDYWSLALVLFELAFGHQPLVGVGDADLRSEMESFTAKHLPRETSFLLSETGKHLSQRFLSMLRDMLEFEPGRRLSFHSWYNHPWWECTQPKYTYWG